MTEHPAHLELRAEDDGVRSAPDSEPADVGKPQGVRGRGRRRASAEQDVRLEPDVCSKGALHKRTLTVNASGQIRSTKEACP